MKKIFDENNIDVIVHLAAMAGVRPSIENPILYQEVNGIGTLNILEQAKRLIKYKPQTKFEDGIKKFVEWYKH